MTVLAIIAALLGAVFGLRFKVLILVPAMLVGMTIAVVAGIAAGQGTLWLLLSAALIATALQLGYLAGVLTRYTMAAARTGTARAVWDRAATGRPSA